METYTREIGKTISPRDTESIFTQTGLSTRGNGSKTSKKAMVSKPGQTGQNTRAVIKTE